MREPASSKKPVPAPSGKNFHMASGVSRVVLASGRRALTVAAGLRRLSLNACVREDQNGG